MRPANQAIYAHCTAPGVILQMRRLGVECLEEEANSDVPSTEEMQKIAAVYDSTVPLDSLAPDRRIQLFQDLGLQVSDAAKT